MTSRTTRLCCLLFLLGHPYALARAGAGRGVIGERTPPAARQRAASRAAAGSHRKCRAADRGRGLTDRKVFESLRERARADGAVAVVVRLCVPFRPEGELSDSAARRQRAEIARAQAALLKSLDGFKIASFRRYQFTPFVSMSVSEAALLRLRSLPGVADVTEDAAHPPARE